MLFFYLSLVGTSQDKQKVQRIYEQYYGLMMHIANRYYPQRSDAEDVVHDAIVKIIKHLACIDTNDQKRTRAFCVTVVKHTALDRLKAKENNLISIEDFQEEPTHAKDFAIDKDTYADLVREIRALSDPYRIVLTLKYVNDMTDKEIAALLDLSEKTVSVRLSRGRQKLRKALEEAENYA
jgi:RNA polymerase sigma-70 factor (ECF subfamily)